MEATEMDSPLPPLPPGQSDTEGSELELDDALDCPAHHRATPIGAPAEGADAGFWGTGPNRVRKRDPAAKPVVSSTPKTPYERWRRSNALDTQEEDELKTAAARISEVKRRDSVSRRRSISLVVRDEDGQCVDNEDSSRARRKSFRRRPPPVKPNTLGTESDYNVRGSVSPRNSVSPVTPPQDTKLRGSLGARSSAASVRCASPLRVSNGDVAVDYESSDRGDGFSGDDLLVHDDEASSDTGAAHRRKSFASFAAVDGHTSSLGSTVATNEEVAEQNRGRRQDMRRRMWNNSNGDNTPAGQDIGAALPNRLEEMDHMSLIAMVRALRQDLSRATEREACLKKELSQTLDKLEAERLNAEDLSDALAAQKAWNDRMTLRVLDRCPDILSSVDGPH
eukprot:m.31984 g.31984  ORF g.31984 m.31984 type:complete len:394 (-) comp4848_c0_seq1:986-2167(-)